MKCIILFILTFINITLNASNIEFVSGNISYKHVAGGCPSAVLEITVNIFTKQNTPGDSIYIYFGDGVSGYIKRASNYTSNNHITHNIYKAIHPYPSCGTFNISYVDTIHSQPIKNLGTNDTTYFFLSSDIILNPFYPHNNSYLQFNSPAVNVFKNYPFNFNTICSTNNILNYDSIIHSFAANLNQYNLYLPSSSSINRTSGEIQWQNPDTTGSFIFVINTAMYKYGNVIESSVHFYKFDVIAQSSSYIYDSIDKIPVNMNGYKEILYSANNTYSFSTVYTDLNADSVKLVTYPIDFFMTVPIITITKNNLLKNSLFFSWSPIASDERTYPYNFVLNAVSYYPNDSVANSYQTVSFINSNIIGLNEESLANSIKLFPNPVNSILKITDAQNQFQNSTVNVKNTLGQTVLSLPFHKEIDVCELANGLYFLQIKTEDKQLLNAKFIKE